MYLKNEHFKDILIDNNIDQSKMFNSKKRLSSKAFIFSSDKNIAIIYVNTIVFLKIGKRIVLDTAGWYSETSKNWINHGFSLIGKNYNMHRKNWIWYIDIDGKDIEFFDEMTI